jgi:protoporphyrinogen oxidase
MVIILGAGLAGLSAAFHLGKRKKYTVLEKESEVGGLCKSICTNGYVFDCAPHILYTRDEYVKQLTGRLLAGNLLEHYRKAYIYMRDTYVKYPFEVNMHGLPKDVIDDCIEGVRNMEETETKGAKNFKEWIHSTFGAGIANHYMVPYNEKVWKYDLSKMNVDWIAGRVPSPDLKEMIRGAEGDTGKDFGPNAYFSYPRIGGIGAIAERMSKSVAKISLDSEVVGIKSVREEVEVTYINNGATKKMRSNAVISSIPLPSLINVMEDVPKEVRKAADDLVYNSIVCVNVGVDRPAVSDKHWLYFPEKEFVFNRISFPMNFSEHTTPKGRSSILVEVTYRGSEMDAERMELIKQEVREGLVAAELLKDDDRLDVFDAYDFKYAYVIYDLNHKDNVGKIHKFLKQRNIIPVGRFGEWGYLNMDKAIISGKNAADETK